MKECVLHTFLARFHSALMGFNNTANRRVGGESEDKYASFSYTSLFNRINIQHSTALIVFRVVGILDLGVVGSSVAGRLLEQQ